ncbi:MAG: ABC transporter ATP-binding protein [Thermoguttaceae bacterium]|nr:ABC transporter ATP-binding protein [Thermoguttaceae bacterium]
MDPSSMSTNGSPPSDGTSGIEIRALTKCFAHNQHPALDGLSAVIRTGRITGLVGPDGAGKTTLLRLIAGLLEPTSGTISVFGFDTVRQTDSIKPLLGYMPQKFGLYEDLTVQENLELYAELRGLPCDEKKSRFDELLRFTSLGPFTDRLAGRLSGGMKQKLGLACALIKMPRLLILDEPGVGVDPISRRELWRMARDMVTDQVIILWSTAYLNEAQMCDEVLLLEEGKELFFGTPAELMSSVNGRVIHITGLEERKRRAHLAVLLRDERVRDGTIQGDGLRIILDRPPARFSGDLFPTPPGRFAEVSPRFEDGYIDILGGIGSRQSGLTDRFRVIPHNEGSVVEARGLTKRYGNFTAADHIDFQIRQGEIMGLLGPNGAGKSTTFKMLCGLLRPTEGEGFIAGENLQKAGSHARSRLGYMAQKFSLYPDLTVRQNLAFYAGVYGLSGKRHRQAVDEMIDLFELAPYAGTSSGLLPLGFNQRLSLAAALMHQPDVLYLDEPTSGVDPLTRREFWGHINALVEKGVTVLVTTHFMDEAEYCDRISLIFGGRKIAEGTPSALKAMARSNERPNPTLEDAFISLVEQTKERD